MALLDACMSLPIYVLTYLYVRMRSSVVRAELPVSLSVRPDPIAAAAQRLPQILYGILATYFMGSLPHRNVGDMNENECLYVCMYL